MSSPGTSGNPVGWVLYLLVHGNKICQSSSKRSIAPLVPSFALKLSYLSLHLQLSRRWRAANDGNHLWPRNGPIFPCKKVLKRGKRSKLPTYKQVLAKSLTGRVESTTADSEVPWHGSLWLVAADNHAIDTEGGGGRRFFPFQFQ